MSNIKLNLLVSSFAIIGTGVVVARIIYLRRKNISKRISNTKAEKTLTFPSALIGSLVGKGGIVLETIRRSTGTDIKILVQENETGFAVIKGQQQNINEAESMLLDIIHNRSNTSVSTEVEIGAEQWMSIIGDADLKIRHICQMSKAQLSITWNNANSMPKFVLKGNQQHINAASSLIEELVAELASAEDDDKSAQDLIFEKSENIPLEITECNFTDVSHEILSANTAGGYVDIFVSVVQNPSQFWVQLVGKTSVALDKISEDMTEFYSDENNQIKYRVQSAKVGELIAAYYKIDKTWYRARVLSLDTKGSCKMAKVFYVDFGDCDNVELNMVCNLKPDYLILPIQAIKCCLSDVEPTGNNWSDEAIDLFEKITYAAEWKVIIAKPMPLLPVNGMQTKSDIVPVILVDTNNDFDINISEELVKGGFAKRQLKKQFT